MARLRKLLLLPAAVVMIGSLLGGTAWASGSPTASPQDGPTVTTGSGSGTSPEGLGTSSGKATFGIQPAKAKGVDGRDGYSYAATPGAVVHDYVAVSNYSSAPLSLHIYSTDAYNTATGGFTLLASTQKATTVGLWITLAETFVTLPAKSTAIIPFILKVPQNASPGDHAGGIVASLTTMTHDAKGNQIAVESRVGDRVAVRVSGKLRFQLAVSKVSAVYHESADPFGSGSATVSFIVTNTGNVRLTGTQRVNISSLFGSEQSAAIPSIKELLPGDSMQVSAQVDDVPPSFFGTARVTVVPQPYPGDIDPPFADQSGSATATAGLIAFPWPLILLVLLVLAAGLLVWRRRRQTKVITSGGGSGGPSRPAGPAPRAAGPKKATVPGQSTPARPRPKVNVPAPKVTVPTPVKRTTAAPGSGTKPSSTVKSRGASTEQGKP